MKVARPPPDEIERVFQDLGTPDFPVMTWPAHLLPSGPIRDSVVSIRNAPGLRGLANGEAHALCKLNWYPDSATTRYDKAELAALDLVYRALEAAIRFGLEWHRGAEPKDPHLVAAICALLAAAEQISRKLDDVDDLRKGRREASSKRYNPPYVDGLAAEFLARPEACRGTQAAFLRDLERAIQYIPSKSNFSKAVRRVRDRLGAPNPISIN